jgi:UDP-N-acetylglucosamine:LPS N-acetylglucosamine transferase
MKILCIASGGGHVEAAMRCMDAFEGHQVVMATYYRIHMLNFRNPQINRTYHMLGWGGKAGIRLALSQVLNTFYFIYIFLKERPSIIFSTGAELAILPFYMGRLFGIKGRVYLDTATKPVRASKTARLIYPACDILLVQWPELVEKLGHKAKCWGRVI